MIEEARERARKLIESGEVAVVIGYREGRRGQLAVPFFARTAADVEQLVLDPYCRGGLAVFATRETANAAAAFVATREDVRTLRVLAQEKQIDGERVRVIAFECDVPGNPVGQVCLVQGGRLEDFTDLGEPASDASDGDIARIKAMTPAQRWRYWRGQFDKCVRCYACRAACPLCYCTECIADDNLPQWIETSARPRGNVAWNLIRAWHLAGRCTGCGACERACPEGIRLTLLNKLMASEVKSAFGYVPGTGTSEEAGVFASFKEKDGESFILKGHKRD